MSDDHTNHLNDLEREIRDREQIHLNPPTLSRIHEYKKTSFKSKIKYKWLKFKHKVVRLILCLSNKIGDKNV